MSFGEDQNKVLVSSHMKGTYYHDLLLMLILITCLKQYLSGFSSVKLLLFFPLSVLYSLEGSRYAQPTLKEWGGILCVLQVRVCLHKLFGFLHTGDLSLLLPPLPLFIQSIIYISMDSYTLGYNAVLLNFVSQIVPPLATGVLNTWILYLFDITPHHCGFLFFVGFY